SEGIFMTRPDGTILSANPEACRILGRAEKEITELGRDKLFDIKDPRFIESLEIRKRKGSFRGEITAIDKDGTRIPLMLTSNIYRDSDGEEKTITIFSDISDRKEDENKLRSYLNEMEKNKAAMLNILKDVNREVTERKSAQEELKKLNTELEEKVKERTARLEKQNRELTAAQDSLMLLLEDVNETRKELTLANSKLTAANKELEAFSYSVSHDLRSPLRAIIGFSNILKEDYCKGLSEEGARYLSKIIDNTLRMQDLIDDLLEFSRVGRSQIRPVRIRTAELLKKIFEEITEGEKSRTFNFSLDEGIPDITADRVLVTQMFQNIIGNAVKFTSKKEIAEIKINYENDGEFHIISIKDNGAGFDEKYKNKIFEVFQRLHSSDEFPGTGVGMSIVAKVASKHGWVLDAESKNLNGAAFYIKIPLEGKKEVKVEQRV
ncbi:MAG: ATP-binding protein, partial [Candidatus Delongbacteria bacterium]